MYFKYKSNSNADVVPHVPILQKYQRFRFCYIKIMDRFKEKTTSETSFLWI